MSNPSLGIPVVALGLIFILAQRVANAQDAGSPQDPAPSRAAVIEQSQAEKAAHLYPFTPTRVEAIIENVEQAMLNEVPVRGTLMPPTDPLIYRFYELVMVNGPALKALIEEEFGDGIMSAIDFDLHMERLPDPRGDRVKITMSGKFLPYKYYGAGGNVPQYGYKEE